MQPTHVRPKIFAACLALTWLMLFPAVSIADMEDSSSSGSSANPDYAEAVKRIEQERFTEAVALLNKVIAAEPQNANAYNLLGYGNRKLGDPEKALKYYQKALAINPKHRGAHEYIGEAWLMLGSLNKAKAHLAILDKDCWLGCEEYTDLKAAIANYERTGAK